MPHLSPGDAFGSQAAPHGAEPRITVCVCSHDRPDYLRDCLDGLLNQCVGQGAFDILVVDSGSASEPAARIAALTAAVARARLLRIAQPGLSLARNMAARAIGTGYVAFLDDDAIPAPDWIATIRAAIRTLRPMPAMLGGAIRPLWEAPLPVWWPARLQGVLSIIDVPGVGEYRRPGVARELEPYGANMVLHIPDLLAAGGFLETIGRDGATLLSDEEKVLAWRLQDAGHAVWYDSRILVHHQIQAQRLTMGWLQARMYWQGVSSVRSGRYLGAGRRVRREAARRLLVLLLLAPVGLLPPTWTAMVTLRWRLAYARGFLREFLRGATGRRRKRGAVPERMVTTLPAASQS